MKYFSRFFLYNILDKGKTHYKKQGILGFKR